MIEIKFRLWSKENEMLIYPTNGWYKGVYKGENGHQQTTDIATFINGKTNKKVEVTQYVGLKDKNGVEIYEGDILNHFNKVYEVIRLSTGTYLGRTSGIGEQDIVLGWTSSDGELIGNIYENPELLKGGDLK